MYESRLKPIKLFLFFFNFNFFFAEVGKILFVENLVGEKRRERLHIGECRGTRKPVIQWVRVGSGFYSLFFIA
jgi:hypothetical protein